MTKSEALDLAIGVAENLMEAMRLAPSDEEKKEIKSRCRAIMDVADRIKSSAQWVPLAQPQQEPQKQTTKEDEIDEWATEVALSAPSDTSREHDATFTKASSDSNLISFSPQLPAISHIAAVDHTRHIYENSTATTAVDLQKPQALEDFDGRTNVLAPLVDQPKTQSGLLDHRGLGRAPDLLPKTQPQPVVGGISKTNRIAQQPSPPPLTMASRTQIRRLKEPISTRKRSKREDILLLKSSVVNGFKFPPWDKNPSTAEFALDGSTVFRYVCKICSAF